MIARNKVNSQYDQSLQSLAIDKGGMLATRTVCVGVVEGCEALADGALFCAIRMI